MVIERLLIWIRYKLAYKKRKNPLPTVSKIKNPKMHYDIWSDSVYWEDEGLEECSPKLADAFKFVIRYRTALLANSSQSDITKEEAKCQKFFEMAKKNFPNWIGFDKNRCSYNPEISDKIKRIRKVSEWKIDKLMNEKQESQKHRDKK